MARESSGNQFTELEPITQARKQAQDQKPPTPNAIAKALLVLTTRYRVTLEPLPKARANEQEACEAKEIIL